MKIVSAEFIKSAFAETDWPRDERPEIAFLGRSNVGKSSLINSLLGVKGLARTSLVLSIQIVDSRHEPTTLDLQLNEWLAAHQQPRVVVATKSDKLSNNELRKNLERVRTKLDAERVIAYSAVTGKGREEVWRTIE